MELGRRALVLGAASVFASGCRSSSDPDAEARAKWIATQASSRNWHLRAFLNGTPDMQFYDGWYNIETDPSTGGAWRWMDKKGIVRLRTRLGSSRAQDMELSLYGWVPHEHVGLRTNHMEFAINGHVIGRFEPPRRSFEHKLFVPRWLLEQSDWVDFTITVANTARPPRDWRDLGFATTGFVWKPVAGG
jgi:hypothetical protein